MSLMERRLQLLLDNARYELVAAEAERSGRSVAAVIREAIDRRFDSAPVDVEMAAAVRLLSLTATTEGVGEGPQELKDAHAAELDRKARA